MRKNLDTTGVDCVVTPLLSHEEDDRALAALQRPAPQRVVGEVPPGERSAVPGEVAPRNGPLGDRDTRLAAVRPGDALRRPDGTVDRALVIGAHSLLAPDDDRVGESSPAQGGHLRVGEGSVGRGEKHGELRSERGGGHREGVGETVVSAASNDGGAAPQPMLRPVLVNRHLGVVSLRPPQSLLDDDAEAAERIHHLAAHGVRGPHDDGAANPKRDESVLGERRDRVVPDKDDGAVEGPSKARNGKGVGPILAGDEDGLFARSPARLCLERVGLVAVLARERGDGAGRAGCGKDRIGRLSKICRI